MSKPSPPAASAASAAASPHDHLSGVDIAKVMTSTGPTVKCVLLRATPTKSCKCPSSSSSASIIESSPDVGSMSIKEMKRELQSYEVDTSSFVEKGELVKALNEARASANDNDKKPSSTANDEAKIVTQQDDDDGTTTTKPVPLQHLIDEISVDTTPRKSMVSQILGGSFTFLGQYEDEGIMVMIRRPDWEEEDSDEENSVEDGHDIPPVNPHELQPPLHNVQVRGDILLMRVAETDEVLDNNNDGNTAAVDYEKEVLDAKEQDGEKVEGMSEKSSENGASDVVSQSVEQKSAPEIHVPTNDEFFLDYTKEEYLKFAARTDIVAEEIDSSSEEEGEESDNEVEGGHDSKKPSARAAVAGDDENDQDFDPQADDSDDEDLDSEEHQVGMMNMILGHMLRKFREENGRGPDSLELLEMRKALADRLGVDVPPVDEEACDWDKKSTPNGKGKKKFDGRKVVVAEDKNETEEIPRRDEEEDSEGENGSESGEHELERLKRPAQEVGNSDEQQPIREGSNKKKAKLNNGENGKKEEGGEES